MFFLGLHIFTYSDTFQVHKSGPPCFRLSWQSLNLTGQNRSRKTIRSSKHLTVCLSVWPSVYPCVYLSVCQSLSLSLPSPSVHPSIHPSIHASIHPSMAFSLRMPNWLAGAATLGAKQPRSTIRQWYRSVIYIYIYTYSVNPGLINYGLLTRGVLLQ